MKKTIIILGILILSLFSLSAQEEILNNETINIKVSSPISLSLNKDFNVTPDTIVVRKENDLQIIAGQTIISKYEYENKLDYSVVIKQELNLNIETNKNSIATYLAQESETEECLEKNGSLLKYNNQRITVFNKKEQKHLCFLEKKNDFYFFDDKLVLELEINPGKTTKYLLIVTTPQLAFDLNDNTLVFEDQISIDSKQNQRLFDANYQGVGLEEFGPITTSDENGSFLGSLRDIYNNQARRNLNNNYSNNTKDLEISSNKQNLSKSEDVENNLKSKATALVTFIPSTSVILGILVFLILYLIYRFYKKKKIKGL